MTSHGSRSHLNYGKETIWGTGFCLKVGKWLNCCSHFWRKIDLVYQKSMSQIFVFVFVFFVFVYVCERVHAREGIPWKILYVTFFIDFHTSLLYNPSIRSYLLWEDIHMLGGEVIRQSSGQKSCFFPHPRCPKIRFFPDVSCVAKTKLSNIKTQILKRRNFFFPKHMKWLKSG